MNYDIFKFHFEKRAKIPWYFGLGQALGHVVDGLTGLVMLPFGRYGTSFSNYALNDFCVPSPQYSFSFLFLLLVLAHAHLLSNYSQNFYLGFCFPQ